MPLGQLGPYRIVKMLGEGGMGVVYEAMQEPIQRRVALKVLLPQHARNADVLNRFFNEARAVNLIEHPGLVQISDYGQAPDGTAYLVMELLRGETLSERLERRRNAGQTLSVGEALQIATQIADALCAAHEKTIVHRDLKPSNIMLVRDSVAPGGERAKILDFGIAKLSTGDAKGTATNAVMGTPRYMSPEQCRGAGGVDDKTDVYSLSILLYEMLAGRTPFVAQTALEYMAQHAFDEPPPLQSMAPAVPSDVAALVHQLLGKDKSRRPPMREALTALTRLLPRYAGTASVVASAPEKDRHEAQRPVAPAAPPSTIGSSHGQTHRRLAAGSTSSRSLLAATIAAALLGTATGSLWYARGRVKSTAATVPALPARPASQGTVVPSAQLAKPQPSSPLRTVERTEGALDPQRPEPIKPPESVAATSATKPAALGGSRGVSRGTQSAPETGRTRPKTPSAQPKQPRAQQETAHEPPPPSRPSLRELLEK